MVMALDRLMTTMNQHAFLSKNGTNMHFSAEMEWASVSMNYTHDQTDIQIVWASTCQHRVQIGIKAIEQQYNMIQYIHSSTFSSDAYFLVLVVYTIDTARTS